MFRRRRKEAGWGRLTFCEVLDADVVELLDLLHDEVLLVDLDDDRGVARVAAREAELAEGGLELLRDVDGAGLRARGQVQQGGDGGGGALMLWVQKMISWMRGDSRRHTRRDVVRARLAVLPQWRR